MPVLETLSGQTVSKVEQYKTEKGLDVVKIHTDKGIYSLSVDSYFESETTLDIVSNERCKPLNYLEGRTLSWVSQENVEHGDQKTNQRVVFEFENEPEIWVVVKLGVGEIYNYNTIYEFVTLENKLIKDDMSYTDIVELLCEIDLNEDDLESGIGYEYPNLKFEIVESVSNTDGSAWTVYYFPKQDVYIKHIGFYNSYDGCTEYEDHEYRQVFPKTVVGTNYVEEKTSESDFSNNEFEEKAIEWFKDNFQNVTKEQIIDLYGKYVSSEE